MERIQKRVPADTSLKYETFLNNKQIDGELYGFLLSLTIGKDGETLLPKKAMPSWQKTAEIMSKIKPITRQTVSKHFKILVDKGYIKEYNSEFYIFPREE